MGKIIILDENTANKIAAGEVVERPASVVKELVENSIDAGADTISVEIKNGGIKYIKVSDNGSGFDDDDVEIAFERHATSKITSARDLDAITTLGFRGEALASIAAVSNVQLITRTRENTNGMIVEVSGGIIKDVRQTGCPVGTTIIVRDLFFNTPARYKFLKKDSTEAGYVSDIISRIALGNPGISFSFINNGSKVVHTPGNNDLLSTIYSIYGKDVAKNMVEINYEDEMVKITGYAGKPEISRSNRNYQSVYVNGRFVKSKVVISAIDQAYNTLLMKNKYPFIILKIIINPIFIDVNVHPAKMEVKFSNEQDIYRSVYHAVNNAILNQSPIKEIYADKYITKQFRNNNRRLFEEKYHQQEINLSPDKYSRTQETEQMPVFVPEKKYDYVQSRENVQSREQAQEYEKEAEQQLLEPQQLQEFEQENVSKQQASERELFEQPQGPVPEQVQVPFIEHPQEPVLERSQESVLKQPQISMAEQKQIPVPKQPQLPGVEQPKEPVFGQAQMSISVNKHETNVQESLPEQEPLPEAEEEHAEGLECGREQQQLLSEMKFIGQVFSTYIILQGSDYLLLIDQHAAHERIMFEKLKEHYYKNEPLAQELISPLVLQLTYQECKLLEDEKQFLQRMGYIYDEFGNNSIILRSVPYGIDDYSIKDTFMEVLDYLGNVRGKDRMAVAEETLYTIACKSAVKANKKLNEIEIRNVIDELSKLKNPYTCPHGRPTIIKISKNELEKMFKRIV
ncbi:MAG TPA: DNA mismatch repair endonuclease MutL [Clostridiaceae bacterium]|nr:DNA mismatch repair endonuclease MutL [Clostridiaceae bacterium]